MEILLILGIVFVLMPLTVFVGFGVMALYYYITGKEYEETKLF